LPTEQPASSSASIKADGSSGEVGEAQNSLNQSEKMTAAAMHMVEKKV
jgi:hypothetical protein